jgi:hypothetical protein
LVSRMISPSDTQRLSCSHPFNACTQLHMHRAIGKSMSPWARLYYPAFIIPNNIPPATIFICIPESSINIDFQSPSFRPKPLSISTPQTAAWVKALVWFWWINETLCTNLCSKCSMR